MRAVNEKDKKAGRQVTFSEENIAQAESDKQDALDALDQEIATREATLGYRSTSFCFFQQMKCLRLLPQQPLLFSPGFTRI